MSDDYKNRQCPKCGGCVDYSGNHDCAPTLTLFLCGPSKCDHDYSAWLDLPDGGTAVCAKCGATAIGEAMWS